MYTVERHDIGFADGPHYSVCRTEVIESFRCLPTEVDLLQGVVVQSE